MKWEDILKIDINMGDARRLGRNYAIEDMYEAKLISEEEYDRLSEEDKSRYNSRIVGYLDSAKKRGVTISQSYVWAYSKKIKSSYASKFL